MTEDGWEQSLPAAPFYRTITVASGEVLEGQDFGNYQPVTIRGSKFNDENGNGLWDDGELPLDGWTIFLDANGDGMRQEGELSTETDADGYYEFTEQKPGTYQIGEVLKDGWMQTSPSPGGPPAPSGLGTGDPGSSGDRFELNDLYTPPGGLLSGLSDEDPGLIVPGGVEDALTPANAAAEQLIGLEQFRSDARFAGIDGSGYTVAVLDTGIAAGHDYFGPDKDGDGVSDAIVYQYDFYHNDAEAADRNGHGTHVASLLASRDGGYGGTAPGADLAVLQVVDESGAGSFAAVERALQWVVANAIPYNIVAVNMSFGDGGSYTTSETAKSISDELAALAELDVIVVSASGNNYFGNRNREGVNYPSADPNSLSVGAVWASDMGGPYHWANGGRDYTTGPDRIVSFSQRDRLMSDVFAPGTLLAGAGIHGGAAIFSGTSMATPQVTGAVALAQQVAVQELGRRLSLDEIRSLLAWTGSDIIDGDDEDDNVANTHATYKRLDVAALAEGILTLAGESSPSGADGAPAGSGLPKTLSGRTLASVGLHTTTLTSGQISEALDFGNQQVDVTLPTLDDFEDITPDPRNSLVVSVEFTSNKELDLDSLGIDDISLTLDGSNVDLFDLTYERVADTTTYRINGLAPYTTAEGFYEMTIEPAGIRDTSGNPGTGSSITSTWLMDTTAPDAPTDLAIDPDSGTSDNDGVTNTGDITFTGTLGESGLAVTVYDDASGESFDAIANGVFTVDLNLSEGPHQLRADATDAAGNSASVFFDVFVDLTLPESSVRALPAVTEYDLPDENAGVEKTFLVEWDGEDGGSGLTGVYDVYLSVDGGPFEIWQDQTSQTSAEFTGKRGYNYAFYSVTCDVAGNCEAAPETADARTSIPMLVVEFDNLGTEGTDVILADNTPAGVETPIGLTTHADQIPNIGFVLYTEFFTQSDVPILVLSALSNRRSGEVDPNLQITGFIYTDSAQGIRSYPDGYQAIGNSEGLLVP